MHIEVRRRSVFPRNDQQQVIGAFNQGIDSPWRDEARRGHNWHIGSRLATRTYGRPSSQLFRNSAAHEFSSAIHRWTFLFCKTTYNWLGQVSTLFYDLAEMTKVHFPAHPSYFGNEFTQAEIDRGLGALKFLWQPTPVKCDLVLVTEAGKKLGVELDELDPDYLKTIAELGLDAEIEFD